jgi:23S rRNA (uracil1939-C5)-methyltransferase
MEVNMSRRRRQPPKTPTPAVIDTLSHDGRGIARIDGKATFIQGALPGEDVTFQYLVKKKDFDEGKLLSVEKASPLRVEPKCPHFWMCGGCSMQHLDEANQVTYKQAQLLDLLARTGKVMPETVLEPVVGEAWHYRNKARLSVRYVDKKQSTLVGFREKNNSRFIADIYSCAVLNKEVQDQIAHLRSLIDTFNNPKSIAQIEVAAGDSDIALIFRNLEPLTAEDEDKLKAFAIDTGFKCFLQQGGEDTVALFYPDNESEWLHYELPSEDIRFTFHPTDFTQVNSSINRQMIPLALKLLDLKASDTVLDLFCGLGNFSLPIARHVKEVVGVEGSQRMVERATMNAKANQIENTQFFAANLDDETTFSRFTGKTVDKILLDPPRTGALAIVNHMHKLNPSRIVYVSCNPATLARDTEILVHQKGYTLKAAGIMDMFPHTAHVESIALFER